MNSLFGQTKELHLWKKHALNGNSVQGLKVSTCGELSVELHPQSNSKTWINQAVVLFKLNFSSKTWRCQVLVGKFNFKLNFSSKTWRCQVLVGKFNFKLNFPSKTRYQVLVGKFNFKTRFGSSKSWVVQSTESPAKKCQVPLKRNALLRANPLRSGA